MKSLSLFTFILALALITHTAKGQQSMPDSLIIKNYHTWEYKASATCYGAIMDDNGILYFANENGVLKFDGSEWELIKLPSFGPAFSLFISDNDRLYVGGFNEFGYFTKNDTSGYDYVSIKQQALKDMEFDITWSIFEHDDNIFFGSYNGLVRYDQETAHMIRQDTAGYFKINDRIISSQYRGQLYRYEADSLLPLNDQFEWKNDYVFGALPTTDSSRYLMYTSENGFYDYQVYENNITKIENEEEDFLKKQGIFSGIRWNDSTYVFTTWYMGIFFTDETGRILKKVTKEDGLTGNSNVFLVRDKRGNLWTTSYNGINYIQFPNQPIDDSSNIETLITKVEHTYSGKDQIQSATFHFATPGYVKSDLQYSYMLMGFDSEFSPWNDNVSKEYTNLSGGTYEFRVRAKLPDGTVTQIAKHAFVVKTPWYYRSWFIFLGILTIVALVTLIFRLRTQHLKRLNKRLEMIIDNRTKELIEQREQLKETNEMLRMTNAELDNFVYRSSHDLVAPLKSLRGLINIAKNDTAEESQKEYLTLMHGSVERLEEFIKSIMDYSVNNKQEPTKKRFVFDDVIDEIVSEIRYFDNAEKVSLTRNYDQDLAIISDDRRLKIVLSNLITNCVKYHNYDQEEPYIKITATPNCEDQSLLIEVSDNGIGIETEHLDKIFNMFFRASDNTPTQGSGLGLYIVKDTIIKIGGDIRVDSELGKGTRFTIILIDAIDVKSLSSSV